MMKESSKTTNLKLNKTLILTKQSYIHFFIQWVPRHARKRNYCFVCKDDYNDYLEHLDD